MTCFRRSEADMGDAVSSVDDIVLIEAVKAGNTPAFGQLVNRYRNRIYRFLLRHAISAAEAEDLTQEVFIQAYLGLASYTGNSRYLTWLTGIALNLVRNFVTRSPWRLMEIEFDAMADGNEPSSSSSTLGNYNPAMAAAFSAALAALANKLGQLPVEGREALMLVAFEGFTYEEAAVLLGKPVGSVKSWVSRSRKQLREEVPSDHFEALAGRF
ncbi:MAG: hypothetical protein RJA34_2810 [Pseudomonadota bacterium]|jgi:RNA polymerase sigma-70 factor (ECF subfamily)